MDENRISREQHAKLLDPQPGVTVVSAEATLPVTMLTEEQPDVMLLEAGSTEVLALRAAVTMRRVLPEAGVVITDLSKNNTYAAMCVKAGVEGFVLNEADADELLDTVRSMTTRHRTLRRPTRWP